jgi:hypothetical protein
MLQQALLSQMRSCWSTTTTSKGRGRTTDATTQRESALRPRSLSMHLQRSKKVFEDRACQRCGTACTSQWRTGPLGPSTYVPLPYPIPSPDLARATRPRREVSTSWLVVVMAVITRVRA